MLINRILIPGFNEPTLIIEMYYNHKLDRPKYYEHRFEDYTLSMIIDYLHAQPDAQATIVVDTGFPEIVAALQESGLNAISSRPPVGAKR